MWPEINQKEKENRAVKKLSVFILGCLRLALVSVSSDSCGGRSPTAD